MQKCIEDTYKVDFIRSIKDREKVLRPILDAINQMNYNDDQKFQQLLWLIQMQHPQEKIIVFTERRATAVYLEQGLLVCLPDVPIACVARKTVEGEYELKSEDEVMDLILDFAPEANADKLDGRKQNSPYRILLTTDAYGAGVNLQDASVVISYDLAWTADTIIQRAGRILRFWHEPRLIHLYVFTGIMETAYGKVHMNQVNERLKRLVGRLANAEQFSELRMIPSGEQIEYKSLRGLTSLDIAIEKLGIVEATEIEEFSGVSPFLTHISLLKKYREIAKQIPDDISSAKVYHGTIPYLFLLLKYKGVFEWALYDINQQALTIVMEDTLLEWLQCDPDTEVASVNADFLEEQAQICRHLWIEEQGLVASQADEVERIAALYLVPENQARTMSEMLSYAVALPNKKSPRKKNSKHLAKNDG
ncbi:MAG: hypothetical protein IPL28_19900 [Chloroflexi bacterium]|nr:hypothetical protein [Chloroflexota bacterium]